MCYPDSKTKQRKDTSWLLQETIESLEVCQDVTNMFPEEVLCNEKESSSKCFYSPSRFPSLFHSSSQTTCFNWLRNESMREHLPSLTFHSDVPSHIKNKRESSFYASSSLSNMASRSSSTFNSIQTCDSYRYSDALPVGNKTKMSTSHNDDWNSSPTFTEFLSLEIKNLAQDSMTSPIMNVSKFNEENTDFLSLLQQTFENNSSTFFENKFNEEQLFKPSCHSTVFNSYPIEPESRNKNLLVNHSELPNHSLNEYSCNDFKIHSTSPTIEKKSNDFYRPNVSQEHFCTLLPCTTTTPPNNVALTSKNNSLSNTYEKYLTQQMTTSAKNSTENNASNKNRFKESDTLSKWLLPLLYELPCMNESLSQHSSLVPARHFSTPSALNEVGSIANIPSNVNLKTQKITNRNNQYSTNHLNVNKTKGDIQELLHNYCLCKPCAFFYNKKKGCSNGDLCDFCHHKDHSTCALKQWKKHQQKFIRQLRRVTVPLVFSTLDNITI